MLKPQNVKLIFFKHIKTQFQQIEQISINIISVFNQLIKENNMLKTFN